MAKRSPRTGSIRTTVLAVRVAEDQRRAIEDAAVAAGLTVSAFISATMAEANSGRRPATGRVASSSTGHEPRAQVIFVPRPASVFERRWLPAPPPEVRPSVVVSDPAVLHELKRIGNNINQIAHATNSNLPPSLQLVTQAYQQLFETLADADGFQRRIAALKAKSEFNGAAHAQSRVELSSGVPVRPARFGKDD